MRNQSVLELIIIALCTTILIVGKLILSYLPIPNIEIVSFLLILYTLVFGAKRAILITYVFILIDFIFFPFIVSLMQYLLVWPLLVLLTVLFRRAFRTNFLAWSIFSAAFGFLFGFVCAIPHILYFNLNWNGIIAYLSVDVPFNIPHMVGNYTFMLIGGSIVFNRLVELLYNLNFRFVRKNFEITDNIITTKY